MICTNEKGNLGYNKDHVTCKIDVTKWFSVTGCHIGYSTWLHAFCVLSGMADCCDCGGIQSHYVQFFQLKDEIIISL